MHSFRGKLNGDGLFPSERFTLKPHGELSFVQVELEKPKCNLVQVSPVVPEQPENFAGDFG